MSGNTLTSRPDSFFQFTQSSASDTWTIVHGLGTYPSVDVYVNQSGTLTKVIPEEVTYVDNMTCTITLTEPLTGYATVC